MRGNKNLFLVIGFIVAVVLLVSNCVNLSSVKPDLRGETYAGAASCVQCHKNISNSFAHNAHFKTSQGVNTNSIRKLTVGHATYDLNDSVKIVVEKRDSGYYQSAYFKGKEIESHLISIAFGSGEKAQTFAYWSGKGLFQQPLSYFKAVDNWANSPGFPDDKAHFDRAIISRCFECHASFVNKSIVQTGPLSTAEELDPKSIMYGIDCERCHGPAANHVNFHLENPEDKKAHFIATYKSLTRKMKLDMCGVCHSGNDTEMQKPTFTFKPGDKLDDFYNIYFGGKKYSTLDVHGKQNQMLASSKCFIKSNMDCESCHNTHETGSMNLQSYSQKCVSCHSQAHKLDDNSSFLAANCIDCHMPVHPSKVITFKTNHETHVQPYLLRTHKIAVYPEETEKVLKWMKSKKSAIHQ
ncbi:MAG: hypothetical protein JWQ25_292 [Daejeonella sp.]|nr:hypothetical protein [Daejeonella sp.]